MSFSVTETFELSSVIIVRATVASMGVNERGEGECENKARH